MSVGMTVFTTLVGLAFVGLAIFAFIMFVSAIVDLAQGNRDYGPAIGGGIIGGGLGTALACYLAFRWFTIPVTPFTITIGGRKW